MWKARGFWVVDKVEHYLWIELPPSRDEALHKSCVHQRKLSEPDGYKN